MRVLLVAPFNTSKYTIRRFDFFGRRLANGFIRNGHFVMPFSDRDSVKNALGIKSIGAMLASRRLIELARAVQPDLLCLHTFDVISADTVHRIKKMVPGCRVAAVYCDALLDPVRSAQFGKWLDGVDFGFATTGGSTLAKFASLCPVAFIPNLIDTSIDNAHAFAEPDKSTDVFCACGNTGPADRWGLIDGLQRQRPALRYGLYGRAKKKLISQKDLFQAMKHAKVGLNVNQFEGDLYASDRMALYFGNGLLLATYRRSGFTRYFDENEMIFFDGAAELGEQIERVVSDDKIWRAMAERGYRKAIAMMDGTKVTDFIARMTMGRGPPEGWAFSDEIYAAPARDR
jgi:Glycosyl transferases group 1